MANAGAMTPRGLLNADGNYIAQHQAMYDLLKYILMGQQLPDTGEAYQDRLALDPLAFMWVFNDIPPLVEAYAQVCFTTSPISALISHVSLIGQSGQLRMP